LFNRKGSLEESVAVASVQIWTDGSDSDENDSSYSSTSSAKPLGRRNTVDYQTKKMPGVKLLFYMEKAINVVFG
jgi:hypothetical protein